MAVSSLSEIRAYRQATIVQRLRLTSLFAILGLLVFALWYDYQVARPAVDHAYDSIMDMNFKINSSSKSKVMTAKDVQTLLGRQPTAVFNEGPYRIEVYSWVAGLPFRAHRYYAVYTGQGANKMFMRHYKFYLPIDEINPPRRKQSPEELARAMREEAQYQRMMEFYAGESRSETPIRGDGENRKRRPVRPQRPMSSAELEFAEDMLETENATDESDVAPLP